jgi:hypothetical protein
MLAFGRECAKPAFWLVAAAMFHSGLQLSRDLPVFGAFRKPSLL